ncbi:MAG: hypothetical protein H7288_18100 [Kineosporiaceae bacterium]|nr:hypothetical protein [Aeromicrobium sp.]
MSIPSAIYRRIRRRETHSPRSTAAITLAIILITICTYTATEIVLAILSRRPLLITLPRLADALVILPKQPGLFVAGLGIVAALAGLILIGAALSPGRQGRRIMASTNTAAIVDDEAIASALARHAASAGNLHADNVRVTISRREAIVRVTPVSGLVVDRAAIADAVETQLRAYSLNAPLRTHIVFRDRAKVEA